MEHILGRCRKGCVEMGETETYYDEKSESYDETFSVLYFNVFDAITWKYLEPYLPTDTSALVLDAGGGTGRWTVRIAKKALKVVLMDISEGMLKAAAQRIKRERVKEHVVIKKGDITRTGYPDETFDLIFCEHVLFLFKKPDIVMKELSRILKKKARLIISAQNRYVQSLVSLSEKPKSDDVRAALDILQTKKYSAMDKKGNVKIYTWAPEEFREILERNGFHVERIVGKGYTMPLRVSKELFMKKKYSQDLLDKIVEFELELSEKPDALALAGHMQAIAHKE